MKSAEELRLLAEKCRRLAAGTSDEQLKLALTELAEEYEQRCSSPHTFKDDPGGPRTRAAALNATHISRKVG